MFFQAALFVCAQALVLQSISAQCCGRTSPCGAPAFSGGGLQVASASPIAPSGISVQSKNEYCGQLSVCGALPFLGTVGLQGQLPTAGSAAVKYGCGNGEVGITSERGIAGAGLAAPSYGRAGCGCGCGRGGYY